MIGRFYNDEGGSFCAMEVDGFAEVYDSVQGWNAKTNLIIFINSTTAAIQSFSSAAHQNLISPPKTILFQSKPPIEPAERLKMSEHS